MTRDERRSFGGYRPDMNPSPGNLVQRFLSWIVLSQVAMAASAGALLLACSVVLGRPISNWWYAAAFFGSWAVYLRDSAASCEAEDSISQPRRAAIFSGSRIWSQLLPVISGTIGVACSLMAGPELSTLILLGVVGTLGLLHALPSGGERRPAGLATKRFAAWKSIVVSIAWAVAAVGLPILESSPEPERPVLETGTWLVVLLVPVLLADSLLLDLRDRAADGKFGLRTIAVRVGPREVHAIVGMLVGLAIVVVLLGASDAVEPTSWLRMGLSASLGITLAWLSWPMLRRDEPGLATAVMGWRFLAMLATTT